MKFYIPIFLLILLSACAKKGRPEGGPKDENAPILVLAKPAYKTTNFKAKKIRFYFDEYIVLKELNKKLIISPPLKTPPLITPIGTPTKYINIEILDTLKQNTTYTFNFGDAIQDNNENNKIENFKYIFSTGNYIDSLTTKGTVIDALNGKLSKNVNVVLYKLDSTYTDSLFLKQKPIYVTKTQDSLNFNFTNIKKGNYVIMALDEESSDYIFDPRNDKLGFLKDTISLPKDSIITNHLAIFKETQPYKFKRAKQIVNGKIQFGFIGKQENLKTTLLSEVPEDFKSFSQLEKGKDTLNYWHTPVDLDSLNFIVSNKTFSDTLTVKLRKKEIDSLIVSSTIKRTLNLIDTVFLTTNNPIVSFDKTKIDLVADSLPVSYKLKKETINKLSLLFKKEPKTNYKLSVLPNAITDLYQVSNDSLNYTFNTKEKEDYSNLSLKIENKTANSLIIQLLENDKIVRTKYINDSKVIEYNLLEPNEYTIRAIIDENNNNLWDTGNFLKKTIPEKIIYYPETIKLRANWTVNEIFTIN